VNTPYGRLSGIHLTSDEIRAVRFSGAFLGWRGYLVDEVDSFVAVVADAMAEAERVQAALRAEIARLRDYYRSHDVEVDRPDQAEEPGRRRAPSGLVDYVADYTWVQLELAQQFASLLDTAPTEADSLLYHARIRSSLAVEQAVIASSKDADGGAIDREQVRRLTVWLRALAYAVQVQVDGATSALRAM
jgi:DivIVA domain-containing protein